MKKNLKKAISVFICLILVMSLFPVLVDAANYDINFGKYPVPTRTLSYKKPVATGNDVRWYQCAINHLISEGRLSTSYLNVDGSFGPACKSATIAFQKQYNLSQDGSFGPKSKEKLISLLKSVKNDLKYLNKENCWIEAGNHYKSENLSRLQVAAEIYAHAVVGYSSLGMQYIKKIIKSSLDSCGAIIADKAINSALDFIHDHADPINIGGEVSYYGPIVGNAMITIYIIIWNKIDIISKPVVIHSALNKNQVIDVDGNSYNNGKQIQIYHSNSSKAQQFYIFHTGDGDWCNIIRKETQNCFDRTAKCLDIEGNNQSKKTRVQLYEYNGTQAQEWRCEKNGSYTTFITRKGYCLDVKDGNSADKTPLWIYDKNNTNAQKWIISAF